jgi:hypothetical protein
MKTKAFDCVEMKRQGAAIVQEKIAGMSVKQELDYWRRQTNALRKRQNQIQRKRKKSI